MSKLRSIRRHMTPSFEDRLVAGLDWIAERPMISFAVLALSIVAIVAMTWWMFGVTVTRFEDGSFIIGGCLPWTQCW